MTGIRAVKAFRKEKRNESEFGGLVEDYRDVNARVIQLFGIFDPGLVMIGNVTVGVVLLVGGFRVADGGCAIGALLAALLYTRRFFDPMEEMAMFYNSYQSAAAALEKISGVLEEEPTRARPGDAGRPLAVARSRAASTTCEFAYKEDRVILPRLHTRHPGRADDRPRRIDRCRQVDAREAHLALLRPDERVGTPRRRRPARPAPEGPPPRDRHGHAGGLPVQRVGRRQHRARQARCDA